jgi:hypothetical protein
LSAKPESLPAKPAPAAAKSPSSADTGRTRAPVATRTGEHRKTAETTRQMPVLASPRREVKRDATRPATIKPQAAVKPPVKPKKAPSTVTATEHVVIADAVRLLGWGKQWHELADMIARLSERPSPSEIRRVLRTYREQIDAVATRRRD